MQIMLGVLFVIVSILLIIVVLLQKGRGGGLGGAFGGIGSTAFGTRVGDVLTWVTIVLTGLFLLLAVGTTLLFRETRKVDPVVLTPAQGVIDRTVDVTMRTNTKGAKIYYTLDAAEPSETSTLYQGPVKVAPGTVVKARAYLPGAIPSDETLGNYIKQEEPLTSQPEAGLTSRPAGVAASAPAVSAPAAATAPTAGAASAPTSAPAAPVSGG